MSTPQEILSSISREDLRALTLAIPGTNVHLNNRPLEYVGDKALGLIISSMLLRENPKISMGEIADLCSTLTSNRVLAHIAQEIELHTLVPTPLEISRPITKSGDVWGDMLEAIVGAVYVSDGLEAASQFVQTQLLSRLPPLSPFFPRIAVTRLRYTCFRQKIQQPQIIQYMDRSGEFVAHVFGAYWKLWGAGYGTSPGYAANTAAKNALSNFVYKKIRV